MIEIQFKNVHCLCFKKKIKKLFTDALIKKYGKKSEEKFFGADIRFVSEEEINALNVKFRNVDRATDVLSFPMYELSKEPMPDEDFIFLGDIAICKKVAIKQAKEYGHSLERELCFLALHGFLHLLGYDHIEKEDEEVMMRIAKEILEENGEKR